MEHSWWTRQGDDEARTVLSFQPAIAPTKALIVPLSNQAVFDQYIKLTSKKFYFRVRFRKSINLQSSLASFVAQELRKAGILNRVDDSHSAIGRRYSRNDELGTPFAITIDFPTVKDQTVTLRERDSTKQIRESVSYHLYVFMFFCFYFWYPVI